MRILWYFLLCVCVAWREHPFPFNFSTLLPLKSNLSSSLLLEFNVSISMSSQNPCKAFWDATLIIIYFTNEKMKGLKTKNKLKSQVKLLVANQR